MKMMVINSSDIMRLISAVDCKINSLEDRSERYGSKEELYDELIKEYERIRKELVKMKKEVLE